MITKPPSSCSMRYEVKMECDHTLLPVVQSWVNQHPAGFRTAYPIRQVNSLYMDTLSLDTFNDHIESSSERRKLRYRWYGPDLGTACGHLELKNKTERAGWKITQAVEKPLCLQTSTWSELLDEMVSGMAGGKNEALFKEMIRVSRPLVINCYQREYYECADGRVRLTLDYRQQVYDQWSSSRPNISFLLPAIDILVIEFKCDVTHARYLADILAEFPLRVNRHSKYVSALRSLLEY